MAKLSILLYPSPVIRKKSVSVTSINGELQRFIDDMVETMYAAPGMGLAAPQVGALKRVIVLDPSDDRTSHRPMALINPVLVAGEGQIVDEEGCLCIPDLNEPVSRFKQVVVKAYDRNEKEIILEGADLLARILQHEIDHLDGILFIDRLSTAKRLLLKRRLKKAAKQGD
ncbi:MAG: peptide deformylase [Candidatus Methylomirabilis oxygeniifera]|uniref:Peptide deformylase n=1 Tax=Methylomirabilis oxygeniifera TaxID=671143 RepID=D5MJM0_METO1|nr:MAG: peptide deformylase [Candidatus Methylomirabilis oxyfera]CBE69605.1 Peptide deformylase (PDF) (Polypeptide deformylase) [Candidatus Methylomirabilis oxyfera]